MAKVRKQTRRQRLRRAAERVKRELAVYRLVLSDRRTPWLAKLLLGAAVGYLLLPLDIIPDFIPVLGYLDDAILVSLLVGLAIKMIPPQILQDSRRKGFNQPG